MNGIAGTAAQVAPLEGGPAPALGIADYLETLLNRSHPVQGPSTQRHTAVMPSGAQQYVRGGTPDERFRLLYEVFSRMAGEPTRGDAPAMRDQRLVDYGY